MLLRNLDVQNNLCNGTRLRVCAIVFPNSLSQVEQLGRFILMCTFVSGPRSGEMVIIPRIDNYCDQNLPFRLRRRQFPVRVSFAITINKSQGQSFTHVGISLRDEVFSHGQLYVALSRITDPANLWVETTKNPVLNVVYREVFE